MQFMSSDQQAARDAMRAAWPYLLADALPVALKASQEDAAVALVVLDLWPAMRPDDDMRLNRAEQGFLLRGGARPDGFDAALIQVLAAIAEERFRTSHAGNRHARGTALRRLVGQEVGARQVEIRDEVDKLFETQHSHWFAWPAAIRGRVLQELSDRLLDELLTFGGGDDTEPKRKLKIVTALATLGGSGDRRADRLQRIGDGKTAGFPYGTPGPRPGRLSRPGALLPGALLARLRRRVDELFAQEGDQAGAEFKQEPGCHRLANLVDKGAVVRAVIAHPRVLEGARHVLGPDLKLSSVNARSVNPGGGARPLHADMAALPDERGSWVCNTIWMLDAYTPDSGALGLVPGSHRRGQLPRQALADSLADHSGQVLVTGRAGTVVVLNAHAWHAGTAHRAGRPRAAPHAFSCRRDRPRQQDQRRLPQPEVQRSLPWACSLVRV
jgi:hypothetical protein